MAEPTEDPHIPAKPALWFTAAVLGGGILLLAPIILILLFAAR